MKWFLNKKEKPFLVLDIGTEAIKSVIVRKKGDKIECLAHSLTYLEESYEGHVKIDLLENIEDLFSCLSGSGIKTEKNIPVFVLISSPVFRAEVMDCKIQRDNSDARISEEEKETIRKKAFEQAKLKISKDFLKEKGILVEDLVWINLDVIKERIDGYLVKEIKKRKGRVVDVKVLAIFTPRMYLDRMKRTFEELELNTVKISHLAEIVSGFGDGIFLDVGGRLTKAFFIIDKALDDVRYFERGGYNFSSRISENFGLEDAAARQLKEDYSDGKLSPEARGKIKDIFAPERNAWKAETVDLKRAEIRGASIFFMGGGSLLREIRSVFNEKRIILPKNLKKIEFTNKDVAMLPQFVPSLLMALKNGEKNI